MDYCQKSLPVITSVNLHWRVSGNTFHTTVNYRERDLKIICPYRVIRQRCIVERTKESAGWTAGDFWSNCHRYTLPLQRHWTPLVIVKDQCYHLYPNICIYNKSVTQLVIEVAKE